MKNIHILPTDKPSRLFLNKKNNTLFINEQFDESSPKIIALNIYITSDKKIKANVYCLINGVLCKTELLDGKIVSRQLVGGATMDICKSEYSEIILTTNQELIADGVQAIDDEFLEWFVKNPSCESVEIKSWIKTYEDGSSFDRMDHEIIIAKEEPKQDRTCTNNCSVVCGEEKFLHNIGEGIKILNYIDIPKEEPKDKCCEDVTGFYLGTTCPKCNKPFRSIVKKPKQETLEQKQETLEQMINVLPKKYAENLDLFLKGMQYQKDQDKNKYSEEEAMELFIEGYKQRAKLSKKIFDNYSRKYAIALFKKFKKK